VKKTGRDEPIGIVMHICMEQYNSYLYLKLAKTSCFSFYLFSSTKSENRRVEQVLWEVGGKKEGWHQLEGEGGGERS
jgi:hypothetical protein